MKKLLGAALSLALLFPSGPASAELLKNLKLNGSLDVRALSANNLIDVASGNPDHISTVQTRTMLNAGWDLLDDVHAMVTLRKNDRTWGTEGQSAVTDTNGGNQALVGDPYSHRDLGSNVVLQQANVKIDKVMGMFDVTIGRQYYGEPSDFAIHYGPKGSYGMYVTAIDAFRVDNENDWVKWSGLAGETAGAETNAFGCVAKPTADLTGTGATAIGSSSLSTSCPTQWTYGVDTWIKNLPVKAGPFLWWRRTELGGVGDNLFLYGARVRAEAMGAWLAFDIGANAGENRAGTSGGNTGGSAAAAAGGGTTGAVPANYDGWAMQLKAGYKADIPNVAAVSPWGTLAVGSGRSSLKGNQNKDFQSITNSPTYGFINAFHSTTALNGYGNGLFTSAGLPAGSPTAGLDSTKALSATGDKNKLDWGIGAKVTPAALSKLTVGASFWNYWYQHATEFAGESTGGVYSGNGNRHIGTEIDAEAAWKHSDNVSFLLQVGHWMPGGFVKEVFNQIHQAGPTTVGFNSAGPSPINAVEFDTNIRF